MKFQLEDDDDDDDDEDDEEEEEATTSKKKTEREIELELGDDYILGESILPNLSIQIIFSELGIFLRRSLKTIC